MEKSAGVKQELPVDLLFEILAKLPVKSLCRLRCVSKLWRSVIADPLFAEARSRAPRELLILLRECTLLEGRKPIQHAYICKLDAQDPYINLDGTACCKIVPDHNPAMLEYGHMSHQIGGLYCLDFHDFVRVWNPSTRESLDIRTVEAEEADRDPHFYNINLFGFDPVERKHKILSISTDRPTRQAFRSRVFILEENRWRTLADVYPPRVMVTKNLSSICADGVIFSDPWEFNGMGWSNKSLVAFHVGSETFQVIPFPAEGTAGSKTLIELSGRATLVECDLPNRIGYSQTITMWTLEDLHQQVWRRKTCTIPLYDLHRPHRQVWKRELTCTISIPQYDPRRWIPCGGTPTGELVLSEGHTPEYLLLYNAESSTLRRIEVKKPSGFLMQIYFHVESLQSPKGASSLTGAAHSDDPRQIPV